MLDVAPSGYYVWLKQPLSNRAHENARLLRRIRASLVASHGIYVSRPNRAVVTDITYVRTWQWWLYPAVVMGLLSRKVVG